MQHATDLDEAILNWYISKSATFSLVMEHNSTLLEKDTVSAISLPHTNREVLKYV